MKIIQSSLLKNFTNISHCFTTKKMGNFAFHVNDNTDNVILNHASLAKVMKYNKDSLIHMKQIHSSNVHLVNITDNFANPPEYDALITNKKNTPLMVMVADCSPILFYDSLQNVIGVAHAGRQGAFKNIIKNTLINMQSNFSSDVKDIFVSIGASIGACCYEVGEEIYKESINLNFEYAIQIRENRFYLDISKILYTQLVELGIEESHIDISKECTCCLKEKYYSYRAQASTGRFCGVIMLT